MRAICVDDELIMLHMLKDAVDSSADIDESFAFDNEEDAINCVKINRIDVAFLDIELTEMSGIELAKKLKEIRPNIAIVYCTGFIDYALDALKMHADGYLLKPISMEDVQSEIDNIKNRYPNIDILLQVSKDTSGLTFLNRNDVPLKFNRKKAAELLELLINNGSKPLSSEELNATLLGKTASDDLNYLWRIISDLRNTLKEEGIEEILIKQNQGYYIDTRHIRFLNTNE